MRTVPAWVTALLRLLAGERGEEADMELKARAAFAAHVASRRALAIAVSGQRREAARCQALSARARDLEDRAVEAARGGRDDMARLAAEAIAAIECELASVAAVEAEHRAAVSSLRGTVEDQRRRLSDLDRGRRLSDVRAALARGRGLADSAGDPLAVAEEALADVSGRRGAILDLGPAVTDHGAALVDDMAEAGFGPAPRPAARDVLARVLARAALPAPEPR